MALTRVSCALVNYVHIQLCKILFDYFHENKFLPRTMVEKSSVDWYCQLTSILACHMQTFYCYLFISKV